MKILWIHGEGRSPRQLAAWQQWQKILEEEWRLWGFEEAIQGSEHVPTMWYEALEGMDGRSRRAAVVQLSQGRVVRGMSDLLRGNPVVSVGGEQMAWCASMINSWVQDETLRNNLAAEFSVSLSDLLSDTEEPVLVVAHGSGALVAYDALLNRRDLAERSILVTMGSPLGHPTVRNVYGGRIMPVATRRWFHLHNPADRAFATSLSLSASHFMEVLTPFTSGDGSSNHDAVAPGADHHAYLDHPATREWLWPEVMRLIKHEAKVNRESAAHAMARSRPQAAQTRSVFQPTHRALLIGIDRYHHPSIPELKGCVNDTYLMSSVLQECGMVPEQIRMLHNERATAAAIRERLDWLLEGAADGDSRVLFFSGHGAQLESYSTGEVVDRQDECLVAHDFTFTRDSAIIDDDLWELYSQLPYEVDFIAIMDCCHAGGTHRGPQRVRGIEPPGDIRHRGVKWNATLQIWEDRPIAPMVRAVKSSAAPSRSMSAGDKARYFGHSGTLRKIGRANVLRQTDDATYDDVREKLGHKGPYLPLLLQACEEAELAAEYDHGSVSHGAFTYCTAQALRELGAGGKPVTFDTLLVETRERMKRLGFPQTPVLLGPGRKTSRPIPLLGQQAKKAPSAKKPSRQKGWSPDERAAADFAASLPVYAVAQNLPASRPAHLKKPSRRRPARPPAVPRRPSTRDVLNPGHDQRQARDTSFFPWNAVAYLEATFQDKRTFRGSGFCVGRRLLLTAGHCLVDGANKAVSINVFPGLQNGNTVVPASTTTIYQVHPRWESHGDPNHDYGLILLPSESRWMGTAVLSDSQLTGLNCFVAGYPVDLSLNVWAAAGFIQDVGSTLLDHLIDSQDGQSGGPIFHVTSGLEAFAVGIHTQGTPGLNRGIRLTPEVLSNVMSWAQGWGVPIP